MSEDRDLGIRNWLLVTDNSLGVRSLAAYEAAGSHRFSLKRLFTE